MLSTSRRGKKIIKIIYGENTIKLRYGQKFVFGFVLIKDVFDRFLNQSK